MAVAAEACSFAAAFAERAWPRVARLVLAHPQGVKAISSAKLKNDRVDSETLAQVLRADLGERSGDAGAARNPYPRKAAREL